MPLAIIPRSRQALVRLWSAFADPWQGEKARRLNGFSGYILAVFTTHAFLRFCLLMRKDAYGMPLVGKADWYLFHAFSIDFLWIFGYSLPIMLAGAWFAALHIPAWTLLAAAHSILLVFTVLDHETLRFLGMHLDFSLLGTYGNTASIREVLGFVADDQSVRHLPYLLFFGCLPLSFLLTLAYRSKTAWLRATTLRGRPILILALSAGAAWFFLHVIWPGGFRMAKLRPFIETARLGFFRPHADGLSESEFQNLARLYQKHWLQKQGDSTWFFPDSTLPYCRSPRPKICQTGTMDQPGDGLDQDCDGADAKPRNMVLLIFESHRAVHCGHLIPHGATASATPVLDSLALQGRYWSRFSVGGLPTINALMAIHLGIVQHPKRYISSDFVTMANQGFPAMLARHGYVTRFFSAADPAWDNQTPWLRQWYQGVRYDRGRENDGAMFADMSQWMKDSLKADTPFFLSAMTKTNHYPFNPIAGMPGLPAGASLQERMLATMRYADSCMGRFFASIRQEPWFDNTLFLILGDHGFPLGEHGSSTIGYGLYTESTWIPLVVVGDHPRLPPRGEINHIASQIDLAPTLLDLAGMEEANHFMGHSLLRPAADRGEAWVLRGEQTLVESGNLRWHGPWGNQPRDQGEELFDAIRDRGEKHNLLSRDSVSLGIDQTLYQDMAKLHLALLESDRLWFRENSTYLP